MTHKHIKPGFNFIELMVSLLIIGIILTMVVPRVAGLLGKGKKTTTINTLRNVKNAIKEYHMTVGKYPESLQELVVKPEGSDGWEGPYTGSEDSANPEVPKDGWEQELAYKLNPRGSKPPFELWSLGDPDKAEEEPIYAK